MHYFFKKHYFLSILLFLSFSYLGFELLYTYFATLGVDEFWFAHWVYRYKEAIPYRDFSPYKTVLGYYVLLAPVMTGHAIANNVLEPLFFTKNTLALLNTFLFFISAYWLKKFFNPIAVLATMAFFMFAEFILTYSTNIRVDFLAYWFCLFSILLLLDKKPISAGIFLAIGFLISQKALWYIVASNAALGLSWLFFERKLKDFFIILYFNIALVALILAYIVLWASLSSLHAVLYSMFYEASILYQLDWYDSARLLFWKTILLFNPLPFLLWPLTVLSLFITFPKDSYKLRFFCVTYASIIMLCLIPYKQIFPYYTLTALPAFLLMYAAFFSWQYFLLQKHSAIKLIFVNTFTLWGLLFAYFAGILAINYYFQLPSPYLFISFIPLAFGMYVTKLPLRIPHSALPSMIWLSILFFGLIYPFSTVLSYLPVKNGNYQKATLALADVLLKDNSDYLAGIELFYNKNQPIAGMKHLGGPAIAYLYSPTPKLRRGMLSSLYYSPDASIENVITSIQHSSVKFFINNYRMEALPPAIKRYLSGEYQHFWGGIYLYAPTILAGKNIHNVKFSGNYKVESLDSIKVDGLEVKAASIIELDKGMHDFSSLRGFRLKLIPVGMTELLDARFEKDEWVRMLG